MRIEFFRIGEKRVLKIGYRLIKLKVVENQGNLRLEIYLLGLVIWRVLAKLTSICSGVMGMKLSLEQVKKEWW